MQFIIKYNFVFWDQSSQPTILMLITMQSLSLSS